MSRSAVLIGTERAGDRFAVMASRVADSLALAVLTGRVADSLALAVLTRLAPEHSRACPRSLLPG